MARHRCRAKTSLFLQNNVTLSGSFVYTASCLNVYSCCSGGFAFEGVGWFRGGCWGGCALGCRLAVASGTIWRAVMRAGQNRAKRSSVNDRSYDLS